MSERKWTAEQKQAIDARGGSLLVSAAAGSGKTAVLVQRVISLLTDPQNPCDADRLLVVTFTNAAASEMRERLTAALSALIAENPYDEWLCRQQVLLQNAHISTIHSFCVDLLRENFERLDIPPDFRIADANETDLLKKDVLDALLEEKYALDLRAGGGDFTYLASLISSGRTDEQFAQTILRLHAFIRTLDDPDGWLDDMKAMYLSEEPLAMTKWGRAGLRYCQQAIVSAAASEHRVMEQMAGDAQISAAYGPAFESDLQALKAAAQSADRGDWNILYDQVAHFTFKKLGALRGYADENFKSGAKAARDNTKKIIADLQKGILNETEEEFNADRAALRPAVNCLAETVRKFDRRFFSEKLSRGVLDFGDLEQLSLKLLVGKNGATPVAQALSEHFREVLVDEYQDTNPAQDAIFRAVSDGGQRLFMVGDVKQSIYGFRQARPDIFLAKKDEFFPYGTGFPAKIILGKNFRSRSGVTDAINFVFSKLFSKDFGGFDYHGEELVPGAAYATRPDACFEIDVLQKDGETGREEREAAFIAEKVKRMVAGHSAVKDGDGERPIRFGDICILLRSMSGSAEKYVREFEARGIPVYADIESGYLGAYEVAVMVSLLRILDNPLQDVPLLSVLLSPIYGFTPDDVSRLRLFEQKGSLYAALTGYAAQNGGGFADFLKEMERLRSIAAVLPADRLVTRLYEETGFYNICGAMPGGAARCANLRLLIDYAADYEAAGFRGLSGFVRFIDRVDRQSDLSPAPVSESADIVRVMSIHKSKGLEFPVVFLGGCSKHFNREDLKRRAMFDPDYGFGTVIRDFSLNCHFTTVPREVVKLEAEKSGVEEEMRVLYVAMTRAKEKLFAVITVDDAEKVIKKASLMLGGAGKLEPFAVRNAQSYADWLLACALVHPSCGKLRDLAACGVLPENREVENWDIVYARAEEPVTEEETVLETEQQDAEEIKRLVGEIADRCDYTYPYAGLSQLPSKISVSELTHGENATAFSAGSVRPSFLDGDRLSGAEAGTALHAFMQYAGFQSMHTREGIDRELSRLTAGGYLLQSQADAIDAEKVLRFSDSELFRRMMSAEWLYREFSFTVEIPAEEIAEGRDGAVVLQGMADIVFAEAGKLYIVDYKTDRADAGTIVQQYQKQLDFYSRAVSEIMGQSVSDRYIYAFSTGKTLRIPEGN